MDAASSASLRNYLVTYSRKKETNADESTKALVAGTGSVSLKTHVVTVLLGGSPFQGWSVDIDENGKPSFTVPEDPMDELLSEFEGHDPANPYGSDEHFVYLI